MEKIDFVVTWVDGNDPAWQAEKRKYQPSDKVDAGVVRYRDWDVLQYWFRGVEKFAPWVNHIYFVTWGHIPAWLNTENPKLTVVKHSDFIPEQYLPTFSCRPIEFNLHRIPGLSENFVYFNDDMFLIAPTKEEDFFKNGLPCDVAMACPLYFGGKDENGVKWKINQVHLAPIYDMFALNNSFDKREVMKKNWKKWFSPKYGSAVIRTLLLTPWKKFTGLICYHLPYSLKKSTFDEVWKENPDQVERACSHKFRDNTDINSWLLSFWQIAKGEFTPRKPNLGMQFGLGDDNQRNERIFSYISNQKGKIICVNDSVTTMEIDDIRAGLVRAFDSILPEKSSFEK